MKLKLGNTELIQLLGDPQFYRDVEAFLFMEEMGLASYAQYLSGEVVKGAWRSGHCCTPDDPRKAVKGAAQVLARHAVKLHGIGPDKLLALKQFLSRKLDQPVETAVLYYKHKNEVKELVF